MATPTFLKYPTQKLRRLKYPLRQLHLAVRGYRHDVQCETARCGVPGGEWVFCPTVLGRHSVIYSFGVGNNVSFDLGLISKFGAVVHAFDPTPRSAQWVKSQELPAEFVFHEIGVASFDGRQEFFQPKSDESFHFTPVKRYNSQGREDGGGSVTAEVRRVASIMRDLGHEHIDLLKLDIDGGEYDVIADLIATGVRPTQLLVEFHHMFSTIPMKRTLDTVDALREAGYGILNISPRTYEYSMMLKSAEAALHAPSNGAAASGMSLAGSH